MSVTRVEGTRPLEAVTTTAAPHPRTGDSSAKPAAANRPAPQAHDEETSQPVSIFKPYSLSFRYDKDLHRVLVKVIDPKTGELLREIPPEAVVEALKQIGKAKAPGALVDQEV